MDVFVEQIIKKKTGTKDILISVGVTILGVTLIMASMMFLPMFSLFVLIGVCFGAYYVISSRNLEFEYSVTNGDITADKIINRRKRKRVISFDAHSVEAMGKYKPAEHLQRDYQSRLFAAETDNGEGENSWYMTFRGQKTGNTLFVFNPNEKVLTAIKPFLPRQVSIDAFGRH